MRYNDCTNDIREIYRNTDILARVLSSSLHAMKTILHLQSIVEDQKQIIKILSLTKIAR